MRQLTEHEQDRAASIFTAHRVFIEAVARQYAPTPTDVPDVVQSVGVSICRSLHGFRGESHIRTWLYRVTVNAARDLHRREQRHISRPREAMAAQPVDEAVEPDYDQQLQLQHRQGLLEAAIQRLQPKHQAAIRSHLSGSGVQRSGRAKLARMEARRELRQILTSG